MSKRARNSGARRDQRHDPSAVAEVPTHGNSTRSSGRGFCKRKPGRLHLFGEWSEPRRSHWLSGGKLTAISGSERVCERCGHKERQERPWDEVVRERAEADQFSTLNIWRRLYGDEEAERKPPLSTRRHLSEKAGAAEGKRRRIARVMTRVKICGIRTAADIKAAADCGADALGLICGVTHSSEDALEPGWAKALAAQIPPYINRVLVSHLSDPAELIALASEIGADTIQAHGELSLEARRALYSERGPLRIVQVAHVTGPEALEEAEALAGIADALLLDSRTDERLGGTGQTHDWELSAQIVAASRVPVILAGGLRPENVGAAVRRVRPYGVDVNSGVDDVTGAKDASRCPAFVAAAQASQF